MRLVLLPGLDGTGICFKPFLQALESTPAFNEVTVIRYRHNYVQTYAELEAEVRLQLPPSEEFVLLGESFSGPIALSIAATPPPNLKSLILVATFAKNPLSWFKRLRFTTQFISLQFAPDALINFMLLGRDGTPALRRLLKEAISQLEVRVFQTRLREVMDVEYLARACQIGLPCLYLRASKDQLVPKQASDTLTKALKEVQVIDINAPHLLLQVAPEIAASQIQNFIVSLT